jgi:uncharacterized surface protein with fasciclin (FAS1) repeats
MLFIRKVKLQLLASLLASGFLFGTGNATAQDDDSVLDYLLSVDGTQALVAAVLVVDDTMTLDISLAEALDSVDDLVLFAPTNSAFEALLGLESGFLDGLTVAEVQAALPGILDGLGLTVQNVIDILLLHVAALNEGDADDLLEDRAITVASGDELPVSLGSEGVRINYEANVVKGDVDVNNGVIHFIDTVIVNELL